MNDLENRFKTASMGGFVKKDVISYIESMEQEYRNKLLTLEKVVTATQAARSELEYRLHKLEAEREQEHAETERLRMVIADFQAQLEAEQNARREAEQRLENAPGQPGSEELELKLAQASREVEDLRSREAELQRELAEQSLNADGRTNGEILRLQAELIAQRETLEEISSENEALRARNETLRARSEEPQGESVSAALLMELQTQLEQRNRQLISINEKLERTQEKCRDYERTIDEFKGFQSKAEQIELEARKKAERMVAAATEESSKVKAEMDNWLKEIEDSYRKVKQEAEEKITRAYEELSKVHLAEKEAEEPPMRPRFSVISGDGERRNA